MLNLIIKDILIQKKNILLSFIYVVFLIIAFQGLKGEAASAVISAVAYICVITSFAYDDKDKTDIMLNSLPIKRNDLVISKYISVFFNIAIAFIFYIIAGTLIRFIKIPITVYPVTLESAIGSIFGVIFLSSLYFPFVFKYGYIKSRMFIMILSIGIFGFGISMVSLVKNEVILFKNIGKFINSQSEWTIGILIISMSFIIMLISYIISLKNYKNREF